MPISPELIACFVVYMSERGYAVSTIYSQLSAISYSHKILGYPPPNKHFLVDKVIKSVARAKPTQCDSRLPITLDMLKELLTVLDVLFKNYREKVLWKAMFSMAFHGFLRPGELCLSQHTLALDNVFVEPDKSAYVITFTSYKHSKPGQLAKLRVPASSGLFACPVRIMLDYLVVRGGFKGPLFCDPLGGAITSQAFAKIVDLSVTSLGRVSDFGRYKGHCFRIGAATTAWLLGVSEARIKVMGRWSSNAFMKYVRVACMNSIKS